MGAGVRLAIRGYIHSDFEIGVEIAWGERERDIVGLNENERRVDGHALLASSSSMCNGSGGAETESCSQIGRGK